jgi:uncharacterized protein YggE
LCLVTILANRSATTTIEASFVDLPFKITSNELTAVKAQDAVNQVSNTVMRELRQQTAVTRLRTDGVTLNPVYDDDQELKGYRAVIAFSLRVPLPQSGQLIGTVTRNGLTMVSSFERTASDEVQDEAYESSLTNATVSAMQKAHVVADALGMKVGDVVTVNVNDPGSYYRKESMAYASQMVMASRGAQMSSPDIAGGELEISASVNLVVSLK